VGKKRESLPNDDVVIPPNEYGGNLADFVNANRIENLVELVNRGELQAFLDVDPGGKLKSIKVFDKQGNLVYFEDLEVTARIESAGEGGKQEK
jgi:hypothetical protein